uniref:Uncharacterized protein n=1 Tax=Trichinella nativa TaxID=6335 RepID=A0A0V1JND8_9BILA
MFYKYLLDPFEWGVEVPHYYCVGCNVCFEL